MGDQFKKHFPAATLEETCRACTAEVLDGEPKKIVMAEAIIHEKEDGTTENLNEVTFEKDDDPMAILTMLNDFVCIDVSTPQGASNAAAASNGRTNVAGPGNSFDIWIGDGEQPTSVQILGKHV
jgi:hypothetical protein